jgi:hypothetical protein
MSEYDAAWLEGIRETIRSAERELEETDKVLNRIKAERGEHLSRGQQGA